MLALSPRSRLVHARGQSTLARAVAHRPAMLSAVAKIVLAFNLLCIATLSLHLLESVVGSDLLNKFVFFHPPLNFTIGPNGILAISNFYVVAMETQRSLCLLELWSIFAFLIFNVFRGRFVTSVGLVKWNNINTH